MFSIIGIVVVFGCIAAGYLMEHGNLKVLAQPAELIIIGGAALGTVLISNPVHTLKQMISGLIGAFGSSKYGTKRYIDSLKMMCELLQKARKEGLVALETDIEDPDKSPLFANYKDFVRDHHAVAFVCDTMRMAVTGGVKPFDLDQMMELDLEVHHHSSLAPTQALTTATLSSSNRIRRRAFTRAPFSKGGCRKSS